MAKDATRPTEGEDRMPPSYRSLSTQLLVVTLCLVVIGSVGIHLKFLANYREAHLAGRITNGFLVTLALHEGIVIPDRRVTEALLDSIDVQGMEIHRLGERRPLILGNVRVADLYVDLPITDPIYAIQEAVFTLLTGGRRLLAVSGSPDGEPTVRVTLFVDERTLYREMLSYSRQALITTTGTALVVGLLVYLGLQWFLVRAIRRITLNLVAFRQAPDNPERIIQPSGRPDEIGVMERELARMQNSLRKALVQQSRLAALGTAVSKINHDLRSILSTVSITSAQLARVENPGVHRVLPLLTESVERAIQLCTSTLDLARGDQPPPERTLCSLHDLVNSVETALRHQGRGVHWHKQLSDELLVYADRDRLYRILFNLAQNAMAAMDGAGELRVRARPWQQGVLIEVEDTGSGISERVRATLFTPFASARTGGTGLGLATARELARGHGGELSLAHTGPQGSCFHVYLPDAP